MSRPKYYSVAAVLLIFGAAGVAYFAYNQPGRVPPRVAAGEAQTSTTKHAPSEQNQTPNKTATAATSKSPTSSNIPTTSSRPASQSREQQPFDVERQFIFTTPDGKQQIVNGQLTSSVLTRDFKTTVQALQQQSAGDSTVDELNAAFRTAIAQQLAGIDPSVKLDDFACGVQMCFGQIDTGADAATWQAWQKKFNEDKRTQSWVFMEYEAPMPDGSVQHRFAISIDPNLNSMSQPQPRS